MSMPLRLPSRRTKYGAVKTTVDGKVFASKREARRYTELTLLGMVGTVDRFSTHPRYELRVPRRDGLLEIVGHYTADFEVLYKDGEIVIEDVKGGRATKTEAYRLRKKLFEACYWPLTVTEI